MYQGSVISRFCFIHFKRPGWRILFVIPRTLLYRGSLNRGSTVFNGTWSIYKPTCIILMSILLGKLPHFTLPLFPPPSPVSMLDNPHQFSWEGCHILPSLHSLSLPPPPPLFQCWVFNDYFLCIIVHGGSTIEPGSGVGDGKQRQKVSDLGKLLDLLLYDFRLTFLRKIDGHCSNLPTTPQDSF